MNWLGEGGGDDKLIICERRWVTTMMMMNWLWGEAMMMNWLCVCGGCDDDDELIKTRERINDDWVDKGKHHHPSHVLQNMIKFKSNGSKGKQKLQNLNFKKCLHLEWVLQILYLSI